MLQINANKFICDREAKALGLKGPVDFIEGEDGCDKRIEEYMKNKAHIAESSGDKKAFDVCIMNPPYDRNLHLKILEKVIPYAEETINISPIRWLQDPLGKHQKHSDLSKYKETIAEHIKQIQIVPQNESDAMFGARFSVDTGIIACDNNKHEEYKKISDNTIVDKIISKWQKAPFEYNRKDGWRVKLPKVPNVSQMRNVKYKDIKPFGKMYAFYNGEKDGRKWWTFWNTNQHTKKTDEITLSIRFNTEREAENFIKSFETYFGIYVECMLCQNLAMSDSKLLWMNDYTHPWDSRRFCDYFKITGYISDTEAEPGSEWEEILKTMEKYK